MKNKYVFHDLISLNVSFHNNRTANIYFKYKHFPRRVKKKQRAVFALKKIDQVFKKSENIERFQFFFENCTVPNILHTLC